MYSVRFILISLFPASLEMEGEQILQSSSAKKCVPPSIPLFESKYLKGQ